MAAEREIKVPDIGDFEGVEIIEILVKPGDTVKPEDPLITLESDKASMDVPSPAAGIVRKVLVKVGDTVSQGVAIVTLEESGEAPEAKPEPQLEGGRPRPPSQKAAGDGRPPKTDPEAKPAPAPTAPAAKGAEREVQVPDIGDFEGVEIIEILVKPGDTVKAEDPLIALESDKASMEVPAPVAGVVRKVLVKVGDKVSQGVPIITLEESSDAPAAKAEPKPDLEGGRPRPPSHEAREAARPPKTEQEAKPASTRGEPRPAPAAPTSSQMSSGNQSARAYAGPAVRKFARELGVDLGLVRGTGRKGRILLPDVKSFTKSVMTGNRVFNRGGGFALPEIPPVDFSKFGPIESKPVGRLKRLSAQNLHRSWINVPHVTQFDEADISELEEFRKSKLEEAKERDLKLTLLTFLVKAVVVALRKFPDFNTSLTPDGESLVYKQYFHIGFAVNTDQGLMVPVIKDADQKGLFELAKELAEMAEKARAKKLKPSDMQGGCFTISSLGHIGGTGFTPIINTPEVAIMGVSRSVMKPVYQNGKFEPRLILPFSLSYDHRVIDGVAAAEFTRFLATILTDIRHILL